MSVVLSPTERNKADDNLRAALEQAAATDPLRVIIFLQPSAPSATLATISAGPDRTSIRKALIAEQKESNKASFGDAIAAMKAMNLTVHGGESTRALVAEGTAAVVAQALGLPGIKHAVLDRAISEIGDGVPSMIAAPAAKPSTAKRASTTKKRLVSKAAAKSTKTAKAAKKRR